MAATRNDWKTVPFPAAREVLRLDRVYTPSELERIQQGSVPKEKEEKGVAFYEEPWLYLHRSWTGFGIYQVRFELVDGNSRPAEAFVSRDANQYKGNNVMSEALLLAVLLDGYAGRDTENAWKEYIATKYPK